MRDADRLPPMPLARIAVWRRPGMIAICWLYRALAALILAAPIAAIAQQAVGEYPRGDAMLFDRGGVMLVEAGRFAERVLTVVVAQTGALTLLFAVVGLVPMAALVVALGREGRLSFASLLGPATERLGTLTLLLGLALLLEVVAAAACLLLGESLVSRFGLVEPAADQLRIATAALALVVVLVIGVLHDLARVAAVHRRVGLYGAGTAALVVLRYAGLRAIGAYGLRALQSLAALASAAMIVGSLRVEAAGTLAIAWVLHQLALLLAVACRASWLGAAIRLVETHVPAQREDIDPDDLLDVPGRPPLATMEVASSELIYSDRPPSATPPGDRDAR